MFCLICSYITAYILSPIWEGQNSDSSVLLKIAFFHSLRRCLGNRICFQQKMLLKFTTADKILRLQLFQSTVNRPFHSPQGNHLSTLHDLLCPFLLCEVVSSCFLVQQTSSDIVDLNHMYRPFPYSVKLWSQMSLSVDFHMYISQPDHVLKNKNKNKRNNLIIIEHQENQDRRGIWNTVTGPWAIGPRAVTMEYTWNKLLICQFSPQYHMSGAMKNWVIPHAHPKTDLPTHLPSLEKHPFV